MIFVAPFGFEFCSSDRHVLRVERSGRTRLRQNTLAGKPRHHLNRWVLTGTLTKYAAAHGFGYGLGFGVNLELFADSAHVEGDRVYAQSEFGGSRLIIVAVGEQSLRTRISCGEIDWVAIDGAELAEKRNHLARTSDMGPPPSTAS